MKVLTMMHVRPMGLAIVGAALAACASGVPKRNTIDVRDLGSGIQARVTVEVPNDWVRSGKGAKLTFTAPDNFSRIDVSAEVARLSLEDCAGVADRAATEVLKTATAVQQNGGEATDRRFEYRVDGTPNVVAAGRVMCRGDVLATATCRVGEARGSQLLPTCQKVLDSVDVAPGM